MRLYLFFHIVSMLLIMIGFRVDYVLVVMGVILEAATVTLSLLEKKNPEMFRDSS